MDPLIGLDIGGTSVKAVRVSTAGEVLADTTASVGGGATRDALLDAAADSVGKVARGQPVGRVGIAVGGLIRPDGTMHLGSTNLPNLADLPLRETFEARLGVPCRVEHDGRAAMRGEAWSGAAKGARNAVTVTLGTGIGAGLLLAGRIYEGSLHAAGEIGVGRLAPRPEEGPWPTLEEIAAPVEVERRTGETFAGLFAAYGTGAACTAELDRVFEVLGRAIANIHLMLDLEAVVLVGRVTAIGEPFRRAIETSVHNACPEDFRGRLTVRLGQLGAFAGAVGAASLWLEDGMQ